VRALLGNFSQAAPAGEPITIEILFFFF